MQFQIKRIFSFLILSLSLVQSAKILAIFPYPGPSQYIVVQPFLKALAARGHELTVASHHPQKQKLPNFHDIKLEYDHYQDKINRIIELGDSPETMEYFIQFFTNVTLCVLENREIQSLMHSKDVHFDLVILETLLTEAVYAIGPHFKAPLIGVSSFGADPNIDSLVGNTSPISYVPLVTSALSDRMNFWERLENLKLIVTEWWELQRHHLPIQQKIYKKHFPNLAMTLDDIKKNFSLVLLNQHFSLSFPRPYVPAAIDVGGMHITHKPAPLPKDIAEFIDGAKDGVIYFSMGSNVQSKDFPTEKIEILLRVFGGLRQRVIWKFENSNLSGKPDNVMIAKWLPQPDILAHPNVKLFITHAGLLSTMEAIHHAKPIVGIPVFYDQFLNMERAKKAGYGLGLNYHTFTEAGLRDAIKEVLGNPAYAEVIKGISVRYHDRPIKPLEKAIYWTEYVIRYKGAPHLRVAGQDLSFIAYHSIDTWSYVFSVWILLPLFAVFLGLSLLRIAYKRFVCQRIKDKGE